MRRALLIALTGLAAACGPLPHASTGASVSGMRHGHLARYYSDREGTLLHVLVLTPAGTESPGANGGHFTVSWTEITDETSWLDGGVEHRLAIAYRLWPTRFEVEGRAWSLDDGNIFVVKLDPAWRPTVDPIPSRVTTNDGALVLEAIQRARPGDTELASLRLVD